MKVLISQRAEADLARIHGYIAARNPDAAEAFKTQAEDEGVRDEAIAEWRIFHNPFTTV